MANGTDSNLDLITLEILSKIDSFYSTSFNSLMWILSISFVLIGIVVPIILSHIQKKNFNAQLKEVENNFKTYLRNEMKESEAALQNQFTQRIDKEIIEQKEFFKKEREIIEEKYDKANTSAEAFTYCTQARVNYADNEYAAAAESYIISTERYLIVNDFKNFNNMFDNIIISLSLCDKKILIELDEANNEAGLSSITYSYDALLESLKYNNKNGQCSMKITALKKAWDKANDNNEKED